jgi:metallo-beta-lactamase family protein
MLEIMKDHFDHFATEVRQAWVSKCNFLQAENVHYVLDSRESMAIAEDSQPGIIIASSGMGEGGRIIQHLKHAIDDPRCTVVLVSHQTEGSLGSRLLKPEPTVRFAGRDWNKWAEVVQLQGFSGHADHRELKELLLPHLQRGTRIKLVHAEASSMQALQQDLNQAGKDAVQLADVGECTII